MCYHCDLNDQYVFSENKDGNVDVLLKSDFKTIVTTFDIEGKGFGGSAFAKNKVYISTNSTTGFSIFDLDKKEKLTNVETGRVVLHVINFSEKLLWASHTSGIDIIDTESDTNIFAIKTSYRVLFNAKSHNEGEVILGTETGMKFAFLNYKHEIIILEETYFKGEVVQGILEFKPNMILALVYKRNKFPVIDRTLGQIVQEIVNPSDNFM